MQPHINKKPNYIFITGGVLSGLGKGICTASIGKILQSYGFSVTVCKIDPYLNFDAGTMRPTEHGEVWVTKDGGEIDQDLGHYERFLNIDIPKSHNITTGQIFYQVIQNERQGKYLGKTVQPIPHITDEIKRRIRSLEKADFVLVEIGGTIGDYENILFVEAIRQMKSEGENTIFIHVTYVPVPSHLGEAKTKPTQHSVQKLREIGIIPDFIVCRSEKPLDDVRKNKISVFCDIKPDYIISDHNIENIYEAPLIFEQQNFGEKIIKKLNLRPRSKNMKKWKNYIDKIKKINKSIKIGIVGKYFDIGTSTLTDSYISVIEAVKHACWNNNLKPDIKWIDSKEFEKHPEKVSILKNMDAVIVPGGFGSSGIEGKIKAIKYVRENKIPYLGLCLGMQLAVIEFARNVCGLKQATSTEFDKKTKNPVVDIIPDQINIIKNSNYGATMRLGAYPAILKPGTLVRKLYGKEKIFERHRHRYEINPEYIEILEKNGLVFSGRSPNKILMEFMELPNHPYFVATQAHPEFTSRFMYPNPLFDGLIKAAIRK
ncbi:MAG: CTP synthase [Candidatus Aenigmarchaeota archaeon]|nr:CTP synthase [Candidatus Aenigmarchaeota archaeon]